MNPKIIPGWRFVEIALYSLAIYAKGNDRKAIYEFGYGQEAVSYKLREEASHV